MWPAAILQKLKKLHIKSQLAQQKAMNTTYDAVNRGQKGHATHGSLILVRH